MVGPDGKFAVKPERTNLRPILITHAMRHKRSSCNGYKILRGFPARSTEGEGVFTHRFLVLKSNVL